MKISIIILCFNEGELLYNIQEVLDRRLPVHTKNNRKGKCNVILLI